MLSEQILHFARLVSDRAVIIEGGLKKLDRTFADLEAQSELSEALPVSVVGVRTCAVTSVFSDCVRNDLRALQCQFRNSALRDYVPVTTAVLC